MAGPAQAIRLTPPGVGRIVVSAMACWLAALGGIMLLATSAGATTAPSFPDRDRRAVVDAANVIPDAEEAALEARLLAWNRATGRQLVVATVPSLQDRPISDYGYQLLRHWGLGQADADDGVILLLAPTERAVRIEVGYGLEAQLTDAVSGRILAETVTPALREGKVAAALDAGASRIMAVVDAPDAPAPPLLRSPPPPEPESSLMTKVLGVLFGLIGLGILGGLLWGAGYLLWSLVRGIGAMFAGIGRFVARMTGRYWVYLWPLPRIFPQAAARTRDRLRAERERREEEEAERARRAAEAAERAEAMRKLAEEREAVRKRAEKAERAELRKRYGPNYARHKLWCPFEKRILEPHETDKIAERDRKRAEIAEANRRAIAEREAAQRAARRSHDSEPNWTERYSRDDVDGSWDSGNDTGFGGGGGSGGGGGADDRY